jgi:glycosyltransferase involved in cell wall biosynthesis
MRVLVDMSGIAPDSGGVSFARSILPALASLDAANRFYVLLSERGRRSGLVLPEPNFKVLIVPRFASGAAARVAFLQFWLPLCVGRYKIDVLYSAFDYSAPLVRCPIVLGIHNMNPYSGPLAEAYLGRIRNRLIRFLAGLSAQKAVSVLFVSNAARTIIGPQLDIPDAKCHVVHCGVAEEFFLDSTVSSSLATSHGLRQSFEPYVLCVSSIATYKDLESLVLAFSELIRQTGFPHRLVIVGAILEPRYFDRLRRMAAENLAGERISFLGTVASTKVRELYKRSAVVVVASKAETFGMPLAEAMASGVPTIASDIPALREIGGDATIFYAPGDQRALAAAMARLLNDATLYKELQHAGKERAGAFSWKRAATKTLLLIADAAGKPASVR